MTRPIQNVPESVKQRLINIARIHGVPVNEVLQFYAMERFLYRLGRSQYRDRFLLKGALASAIRNTLSRRGTPLDALPALLAEPQKHLSKEQQWSAFVRKSNLPHLPAHFAEVATSISEFIGPVLDLLITDQTMLDHYWVPPGPWSKAE